jgi:hypothetical protein
MFFIALMLLPTSTESPKASSYIPVSATYPVGHQSWLILTVVKVHIMLFNLVSWYTWLRVFFVVS